MALETPVSVLYVAYWGLAEPLGQSLVLPAIEQLAARGVTLTLVTFEKPHDLARRELIENLRGRLAALRVRWIPLRYHKRPRVPATVFDVLHGCGRGLGEHVRRRLDVIHARTYVGGLVGMMLASITGARFVFHNEGFYPDEQVDGGFWRRDSLIHRMSSALERTMYATADGVIALSQRAAEIIESLPAVRVRGTSVIVVPSCVDLTRFVDRSRHAAGPGEAVRLVYVGSIGGRYRFDCLARFVAEARNVLGRVEIRVLTTADPQLVRLTLSGAGVAEEFCSIARVPHHEIPGELINCQAGLLFHSQGLSEHGGSPTKVGEYWAMGLPVVITPNVGDIDAIIERERVGVIIREHTDDAYRRAALELRALLDDAGLAARCRRAAEAHYALAPACDRQIDLYHRLLSGTPHATREVDPAALSRM